MNITEEEISRADSLVEINELVNKCERCSLYQTKTKDVPGAGNKNAEIMFIGEAPGKKEDETGEPFTGPSGKLFDQMLAEIGLERADVYITSVLKHRPPKNRDPQVGEANACWPYLKRQTELIEPKLIVFLGRHALQRFFPELKLAEVHGKAFERQIWNKEQTFFSLYHPSGARFTKKKPIFKDDFNKIPRILAKIKSNN